jgi:hypothetical protein
MGCCEDSTSAESTIIPNKTYTVAFNGGTPAKTRFVLSRIQQSHVTLTMTYPREPKVTRWGCDLSGDDWCGDGERNSLKGLAVYANSGYYHDVAGNRLYLKIHNNKGNDYN